MPTRFRVLNGSRSQEPRRGNGSPPVSGNRINNTWLWLLALTPVLGLFLGNAGHHVPQILPDQVYLVRDYAYITAGLHLLFGILDFSVMQQEGVSTRHLAGWILLPPVYLLLRIRRTRQSWLPFLVWWVGVALALYL